MTKINRRNAIQGALAALAAGSLARSASQATTSVRRPVSNKPAGIKLALIQQPHQNSRFKLARQMGVNHAIVNVAGELSKVRREQYLDTLAGIQADFTAAGLTIAGVESYPVAAENIKLGLPGRDEEIQNYCAASRLSESSASRWSATTSWQAWAGIALTLPSPRGVGR